jgi:molecular chaperone Hsp33
MRDYLVKGYAFGGTVRVYTARTTNLVGEAQRRHNLWPTSTAALGRLLTASVIMGAMYKGDSEFTIRVESDGPIGGMVATTNTLGEVRGYVGNPHVFLQYDSGKLNVGQAVGNGFIHITKDLKVKDMFTSSSAIQTGEIAEDFAYYFTASEQIPSAVGLGVLVDEDNTVKASGGFILQIMPGCKEETLSNIERILAEIPPMSELVNQGKTPEEILEIITEGDFQLLEELDLSYKCNCNKDKFEEGLISLGEKELETIKKEDKKIEILCHFCGEQYVFNEDEIDKLIEEVKKKETN